MHLDILIKNGTVIDGSGALARIGSVGIKDGKLSMCRGDEPAAHIIDARGKIVCPGFIDAHSHGDHLLGTKDGYLFKTPQGITTELCGQCGESAAPVSEQHAETMCKMLGYHQPLEEVRQWTGFGKYLDSVMKLKLTANAKFYVGHSTLRMAVMGVDNRPATKNELAAMQSLLREAMECGAAGLTTGLVYVPGCYADTEEIVALTKVIEPFGGIYASHMRNESSGVVDAVKETIEIGRRAGVRVDISHHKVLGKDNWGRQKETLDMIHKANDEGIPTICDQYPYTRNMTTLRSCMPNWHFSEGLLVVAKRLRDPSYRSLLRKEMEDATSPYDNYYLSAGGWDGVCITSTLKTPEAEGRSVLEYAESVGKEPWEAYFDLMMENDCLGDAVYSTMCEEDLCEIIRDPYCVVGTDGCTISWSHKGHPRASATFPHAINFYVREKKILTLEQMIHKMTGLPAKHLSVQNKGLLKDGFDADVLIIDYDNLRDKSTYSDPNRLTEGMEYVIVNGQVVYHDMEFTGIYSGKPMRHNG